MLHIEAGNALAGDEATYTLNVTVNTDLIVAEQDVKREGCFDPPTMLLCHNRADLLSLTLPCLLTSRSVSHHLKVRSKSRLLGGIYN